MANIYYYKIPIGRKHRVKKNLNQLLKKAPSFTSRRQCYRGENLLVSLENNVATVIYDSLHFSEKAIKTLLNKSRKQL